MNNKTVKQSSGYEMATRSKKPETLAPELIPGTCLRPTGKWDTQLLDCRGVS